MPPLSSRWWLALVGLLCLPAAPPAASANDASADSIMARIEDRHRRVSRAIAMDFTLTRRTGEEESRQILGLAHRFGDTDCLMFVVTDPATLQGTTLLFHDVVGSASTDSSWLYLPGFESPRIISNRTMRSHVIGTDLTYEDSKGWLSSNHYSFSESKDENGKSIVVATPRTDSLRAFLGYSRLDVRIDRERLVITNVDFYALSGEVMKSYAASEFVKVGEGWFPGFIAVAYRQRQQGTVVRMRYEALSEPPPRSLFSPRIDESPFLERFVPWLNERGVRFDAEP